MNRWGCAAWVVLGLAMGGGAGRVHAQCLDTPGDVNQDNVVTVIDVRCSLLGSLYTAAGFIGPVPGCYSTSGGLDWLELGDLNCDGTINVADVQLAVLYALALSMPAEIDADGNQCPDNCDP